MEKLTLKANKRFAIDSARDLRLNRKIPAVVYGKTQESTPIVVEYSDFLRTFRKA
jgi:ribosomal protein L25 (general stress protein Ctc)